MENVLQLLSLEADVFALFVENVLQLHYPKEDVLKLSLFELDVHKVG